MSASYAQDSAYSRTILVAEAECKLYQFMPDGYDQRPPFIRWASTPPRLELAAKAEKSLRDKDLPAKGQLVLLRYAVLWWGLEAFSSWARDARRNQSVKKRARALSLDDNGHITRQLWLDHFDEALLDCLAHIDKAWMHHREVVPGSNATALPAPETLKDLHDRARDKFFAWTDKIAVTYSDKKRAHRKAWKKMFLAEDALLERAETRLRIMLNDLVEDIGSVLEQNEAPKLVAKSLLVRPSQANLTPAITLSLARMALHLEVFSPESQKALGNRLWELIPRAIPHLVIDTPEGKSQFLDQVTPDYRTEMGVSPAMALRKSVADLLEAGLKNVRSRASRAGIDAMFFLLAATSLGEKPENSPIAVLGIEDPVDALRDHGLTFVAQTRRGYYKQVKTIKKARRVLMRDSGLKSRHECGMNMIDFGIRQFMTFATLRADLYLGASPPDVVREEAQDLSDSYDSWVASPQTPMNLLI